MLQYSNKLAVLSHRLLKTWKSSADTRCNYIKLALILNKLTYGSDIIFLLLQMDLNKKREAEISKLRRDVEEANVQHEQAISSMRSKHQQALSEVQEDLETVKKNKAK